MVRMLDGHINQFGENILLQKFVNPGIKLIYGRIKGVNAMKVVGACLIAVILF